MATTRVTDNRNVAFPPRSSLPLVGIGDCRWFMWLWRNVVLAPVADADVYQSLWTVPFDEFWVPTGFVWQYASAGQNTEGFRLEKIKPLRCQYWANGKWNDLEHARGGADYTTLDTNHTINATGNKNGDVKVNDRGMQGNSRRLALTPNTEFITEVKLHLAAAEWLVGDNINIYMEIARAPVADFVAYMQARGGSYGF